MGLDDQRPYCRARHFRAYAARNAESFQALRRAGKRDRRASQDARLSEALWCFEAQAPVYTRQLPAKSTLEPRYEHCFSLVNHSPHNDPG